MAFSTEEFFEAISQIVDTKIGKIKFDTTIICEIKDNSLAAEGKYYVSNTVTNFFAYTDDTSLKNGDSVYVTIPQGDYNNQKMIVGKHVEGTEESYIKPSPLDGYVEKINQELETTADGVGILANFNYKNCDPKNPITIIDGEEIPQYTGSYNYLLASYTDEDKQEILGIVNGSGCNALKISSYYKTNLEFGSSSQRRMVKGTYGLSFIFTLRDNSSVTYSITSNENLKGNPFDYETWSLQENVIMLDEILPPPSSDNRVLDIKRLDIYLTQDGNFELTNGQTEIPAVFYNIEQLATTQYVIKEPNINVKNVTFSFGYIEGTDVNTDLVVDVKQSSFLTYYDKPIENKNKTIYYASLPEADLAAQMYEVHPSDSKKSVYDIIDENYKDYLELYNAKSFYYKINIEKVEKDNVEVHLFQYAEGRGKTTSWAGINWIEITPDTKIDMDTSKQGEKIKAIGKYEDPFNPGHMVTVESNELIISLSGQAYTPAKKDADLITIDYNGSFNFYDNKGFLVNGFEAFKKRQIQLLLTNIASSNISSVVWEIPYEDTNLIMASPEQMAQIGASDSVFGVSSRKGYKTFTVKTPERKGEFGETTHDEDWGGGLFFNIKEYVSPYALNNTIYCTIYNSVHDVDKVIEKVINFGTFDQYGTQYKVAAVPREAKILSPGDTITYDIVVYDADNRDVTQSFKDRAIVPQVTIYNDDGSGENEGFDIKSESSFENYSFTVTAIYEDIQTIYPEREAKPSEYSDHGEIRLIEDDITPRSVEASPEILKEASEDWIKQYTHNNVLKIVVDKDIVGYYPLAVRLNSTLPDFEGPTFVRYNHGGTDPEYYKGKIGFVKNIYDVNWSILGLPTDSNDLFKYKINNDGALMVPPAFFPDIKSFTIVGVTPQGVFQFSQPVVVVQDVWVDKHNNSWINTDINGHVINRINAASLKKSETGKYFDGIILGEVDGRVGLFGFKNGDIVFDPLNN